MLLKLVRAVENEFRSVSIAVRIPDGSNGAAGAACVAAACAAVPLELVVGGASLKEPNPVVADCADAATPERENGMRKNRVVPRKSSWRPKVRLLERGKTGGARAGAHARLIGIKNERWSLGNRGVA